MILQECYRSDRPFIRFPLPMTFLIITGKKNSEFHMSQLKIFHVHKFILNFIASHCTSIKHGFMLMTI